MERPKIIRNPKGLQSQIVGAGVLLVFANIAIMLFFRLTGSSYTRFETIISLFMWFFVLFGWGIWAIYAWKKIDHVEYILGEDALIIRSKGSFGASKVQMYRYDSIKAVTVEVKGKGARLGYGTIILHIPSQDDVVLEYVDQPENQATAIKRAVSEQSSTVKLNTK